MFKRIIRFSLDILDVIYNLIIFNFYNVKSKSKQIFGRVYIRNFGELIIDENFKANSGKNKNPIGGDTILRFIVLKNAKLIIGKNVGISNSTLYVVNKIELEDNVLIGGGCRIWDTNFHSLNPKIRGTKNDFNEAKTDPILIKKNAFVGASSIILKGVTIGENSIIAAGSVVVKSVPDNELWGGNPAKFIKSIK